MACAWDCAADGTRSVPVYVGAEQSPQEHEDQQSAGRVQQEIAHVKDGGPKLAQAADRIDTLRDGSLEGKYRITQRNI